MADEQTEKITELNLDFQQSPVIVEGFDNNTDTSALEKSIAEVNRVLGIDNQEARVLSENIPLANVSKRSTMYAEGSMEVIEEKGREVGVISLRESEHLTSDNVNSSSSRTEEYFHLVHAQSNETFRGMMRRIRVGEATLEEYRADRVNEIQAGLVLAMPDLDPISEDEEVMRRYRALPEMMQLTAEVLAEYPEQYNPIVATNADMNRFIENPDYAIEVTEQFLSGAITEGNEFEIDNQSVRALVYNLAGQAAYQTSLGGTNDLDLERRERKIVHDYMIKQKNEQNRNLTEDEVRNELAGKSIDYIRISNEVSQIKDKMSLLAELIAKAAVATIHDQDIDIDEEFKESWLGYTELITKNKERLSEITYYAQDLFKDLSNPPNGLAINEIKVFRRRLLEVKTEFEQLDVLMEYQVLKESRG
ncbi:MAG: hypothetical protein Q9M91_04985 [Candidatus Dojkabacteria bacterium]|nr:hypothetical protein [Candidatus Dojkabacteria bacterium]MDQ7021162.1 hypothetical protein [Candidatus Dojkabacteria bacterium]